MTHDQERSFVNHFRCNARSHEWLVLCDANAILDCEVANQARLQPSRVQPQNSVVGGLNNITLFVFVAADSYI